MSKLLTLTTITLVGMPAAFAGDPTFEFGKVDEVKDVKSTEWKATAEAGLLVTTGNSETTTLTGGFKMSRKQGDNKFSAEANGAYARSGTRVLQDSNGNGTIDDQNEIGSATLVTAQSVAGKVRYDRFLTPSNSLFAAGLASRDKPAGKLGVIGGQFGYSRQIYKTKATEAVAELGYDYSHESLIGGDGISIHSARAFVGVKSAMTAGTNVDASLEVLTNLNEETLPTMRDGSIFRDTRVNGKLGITASLTKSLSVQTSIEAKYDNRPGPLAIKNLAVGFVPEAASLDTLMKATLIYSFF